MHYKVFKSTHAIDGNASWEGHLWKEIPCETLGNHMGEMPIHFPKTQVKLCYNDKYVNVIFRVEDRYVRAVSQNHQDDVCRDSCVEFFFTPGTDSTKGYFNIEMNCGGTMLFHFQREPRKNRKIIPPSRCNSILCGHSLPQIVDPELREAVTWTVEYAVPLSLRKTYSQVNQPGPGVRWLANFYKCADHTSHPHWLTWSAVNFHRPNFHLPNNFGTLEFG